MWIAGDLAATKEYTAITDKLQERIEEQIRAMDSRFTNIFKRKHGFTLIEVVIIIVVLGILSTFAIAKYQDLTLDAKKSACRSSLGGLRGGISVALALSLPASPIREQLLMATYVVVLFSLLVQGTTIGRLLPEPGPGDLEVAKD